MSAQSQQFLQRVAETSGVGKATGLPKGRPCHLRFPAFTISQLPCMLPSTKWQFLSYRVPFDEDKE